MLHKNLFLIFSRFFNNSRDKCFYFIILRFNRCGIVCKWLKSNAIFLFVCLFFVCLFVVQIWFVVWSFLSHLIWHRTKLVSNPDPKLRTHTHVSTHTFPLSHTHKHTHSSTYSFSLTHISTHTHTHTFFTHALSP